MPAPGSGCECGQRRQDLVLRYRAGKGRAAPVRRITLGAVGKVELAEARPRPGRSSAIPPLA